MAEQGRCVWEKKKRKANKEKKQKGMQDKKRAFTARRKDHDGDCTKQEDAWQAAKECGESRRKGIHPLTDSFCILIEH